jgi:hypothetical protein
MQRCVFVFGHAANKNNNLIKIPQDVADSKSRGSVIEEFGFLFDLSLLLFH